MKKLLVAFAVMAACVFGLSAQTKNVLSLGMGASQTEAALDENGADTITFECSNFLDVQDICIFNNNFALKGRVALGLAEDDLDGLKKDDWFNLYLEAGAGYAFINNDKMTLAVTGIIGYHSISNSVDIGGISGDIDFSTVVAGISGDFNYKITDHFGVTGGITIAAALTGTSSVDTPFGSDETDLDSGSIDVNARLGVSWTF